MINKNKQACCEALQDILYKRKDIAIPICAAVLLMIVAFVLNIKFVMFVVIIVLITTWAKTIAKAFNKIC